MTHPLCCIVYMKGGIIVMDEDYDIHEESDDGCTSGAGYR